VKLVRRISKAPLVGFVRNLGKKSENPGGKREKRSTRRGKGKQRIRGEREMAELRGNPLAHQVREAGTRREGSESGRGKTLIVIPKTQSKRGRDPGRGQVGVRERGGGGPTQQRIGE